VVGHKNVFFLHPSLLHLHPVERSGIFVTILHSRCFTKIVFFALQTKQEQS
jgi:hypothetical protein